MTALRFAYLMLAVGLMGFGGGLVWLGLRRPRRPAGSLLRIVMTVAVLLAAAGVATAIVLEARPTQPW